MQEVVIVGAYSAIAQSVGRLYAKKGFRICVVGRSEERLKTLREDLLVRGASSVESLAMDLTDFEAVSKLATKKPDILFVAHGSLTDESLARSDAHYLSSQLNINLVSSIALVNLFVDSLLDGKRSMKIACIGSVAGDRARQSNYLYGTTKAALEFFLEGVRHKLIGTKSTVTCIKPGFIDTPMTSHLHKGPLFVKPDYIAPRILSAIEKGKAKVYVPGFWWLIMFVIKSVPNFVFLKTKL